LDLASRNDPSLFFSGPTPRGRDRNAIVTLNRVVMLARGTLGEGRLSLPLDLSWAGKDINIDEQVEVELTGRLQMSALAHVAGSTSRANVGAWNAFVF
jgi:hypothetical protein